MYFSARCKTRRHHPWFLNFALLLPAEFFEPGVKVGFQFRQMMTLIYGTIVSLDTGLRGFFRSNKRWCQRCI